jgi:hypothetical protein
VTMVCWLLKESSVSKLYIVGNSHFNLWDVQWKEMWSNLQETRCGFSSKSLDYDAVIMVPCELISELLAASLALSRVKIYMYI